MFNHSGTGFFAFQDVLKRGTSSPYFHWYDFVPPTGPGLDEQGHPNYACFAYVPEMPKLNTANPQVQAYFAEVGRYWVEEFRVDGWRLDVANEISKEFWRVFRRAVKAAAPDCVLIGEVWENARDWLRYDLLDSVMNYDFRRHCRTSLPWAASTRLACRPGDQYGAALPGTLFARPAEPAGQSRCLPFSVPLWRR